MDEGNELLIIGDRVLIAPEPGDEKTKTGLYLPQGLSEKEKVQCGYIVKVGPGYILPVPNDSSEPWLGSGNGPRYVPLQVKEGDYAIFLRREAIEVRYNQKDYLIVPQSGILAVVRNDLFPEEDDFDEN
ncbi:co-chaperone GroES [candidate division KSB1 bacterium]|nr:co-chaperone GroES [candidate division KSB1 bacterium]